MTTDLYETFKQTAIAHVKAYESPEPFSHKKVLPWRASDFIQHLHPNESLPPPFNDPLREPQFVQAMNLLGPVMDRLSMEIQDTVVDVKTRTVVARIKASFDFRAFGDEPREENYTTEYMWLTEMDESGEKVVRIQEFMDVQRVMGYVMPKAGRYLAYLQTQNQ